MSGSPEPAVVLLSVVAVDEMGAAPPTEAAGMCGGFGARVRPLPQRDDRSQRAVRRHRPRSSRSPARAAAVGGRASSSRAPACTSASRETSVLARTAVRRGRRCLSSDATVSDPLDVSVRSSRRLEAVAAAAVALVAPLQLGRQGVDSLHHRSERLLGTPAHSPIGSSPRAAPGGSGWPEPSRASPPRE